MMKGNSRFQLGTGVTSILMIFIVLCLTTFAVLSYTEAYADLDMTKHHVAYIEAYYEAYSKLNDEVARIDSTVMDIMYCDEEKDCDYMVSQLMTNHTDGVDTTYEVCEDAICVVISTYINDKQHLKMKVTMNTDNMHSRCVIEKCYVYTENQGFVEDETLPDMWGGKDGI